MDALTLLDILLSGSILSLTVYFFFVQSPFLFGRLGRAKFVPIMMQMTQLFFNVQVVLGVALVVLSYARVQLGIHTVGAVLALAATTVNRFVVVPRALAAGRASAKERAENPDSHSATDFAVQGGSKTQTKTLHQTVVAVVFANVGFVAFHLLQFLLA